MIKITLSSCEHVHHYKIGFFIQYMKRKQEVDNFIGTMVICGLYVENINYSKCCSKGSSIFPYMFCTFHIQEYAGPYMVVFTE